MFLKLKNFFKDESGASMVEYGIALLVVAALGIGVMQQIGTRTGISVGNACDVVTGAGTAGTNACG
jgi:pilus assembly protein Flp/PilA